MACCPCGLGARQPERCHEGASRAATAAPRGWYPHQHRSGGPSGRRSGDSGLRVLSREAKKRGRLTKGVSRPCEAAWVNTQGHQNTPRRASIIDVPAAQLNDGRTVPKLVRAMTGTSAAGAADRRFCPMKIVQPQVAGRADGKRVSDEVRRQLKLASGTRGRHTTSGRGGRDDGTRSSAGPRPGPSRRQRQGGYRSMFRHPKSISFRPGNSPRLRAHPVAPSRPWSGAASTYSARSPVRWPILVSARVPDAASSSVSLRDFKEPAGPADILISESFRRLGRDPQAGRKRPRAEWQAGLCPNARLCSVTTACRGQRAAQAQEPFDQWYRYRWRRSTYLIYLNSAPNSRTSSPARQPAVLTRRQEASCQAAPAKDGKLTIFCFGGASYQVSIQGGEIFKFTSDDDL